MCGVCLLPTDQVRDFFGDGCRFTLVKMKCDWYKFSKVSSAVTLYRKDNRALTFENFYRYIGVGGVGFGALS